MNVRTVSVRIPVDLQRKLRVIAANRDTTVKALIEDAVKAYLATPEEK